MDSIVDEERESPPMVEQTPVKKRREKLFAVLPTLLTLGNAACGFGAITFAAKVWPTAEYVNELWIAAALIYVAMIFDMFDGSAARWANQTSEFGAQLDSLCDTVSFGVAPAFLMLQLTRNTTAEEALSLVPLFTYSPKILWMAGVMFVLCVLLRLARFNVETEDDDSHDFFSGLPSPAAAGVIASFPLVTYRLVELAADSESIGRPLAVWLVPVVKCAAPLVTVAVACLMISRIRYPHFFNQLFSGKRSRTHLIQILIGILLIALIHAPVLFLLFGYFAFAAPLRAFWTGTVMRRILKRGERRASET